jgi:glycosyltransferase involved in cell wall biosynthesis
MTIAAIILTYNEEKHIERCIASLLGFASEIIVIDSGSNDKTLAICSDYQVRIFHNRWVNYSQQFNYALDYVNINSHFILRIDADEYITEKSKEVLISEIRNSKFDAFSLQRNIIFLDKYLKYGTVKNNKIIRLWRNGIGRIENTWMDERLILSQNKKIKNLNVKIVDHNLNNIKWWTNKHLKYAVREAYDEMRCKLSSSNVSELSHMIRDNGGVRGRNKKIYRAMPIFLRVFIPFFYNLIFKFAFLDGPKGLVYLFLQTFWYRFLVDVIIFENKGLKFKNDEELFSYFKKNYDL